MNEKQKNGMGRALRIGSLVLLAAAVIALVLAAVNGRISSRVYQACICLVLLLFWIVNDVAEPKLTGEFTGRTPEQMRAYRKYSLLNLVGYGGLAFFASSLGEDNKGIYGAVVYLLTMMYKKRFRNEYLGIQEEEEAEEETTGEQEQQQENALEQPGEPEQQQE